MDADLQHPAAAPPELIKAVRAGADLAVGSRPCCARRPDDGYFMVRRRSIAGRYLNPTGYKILVESLARESTGKISETGYIFPERQNGASKISTTLYLQYLQHLMHCACYCCASRDSYASAWLGRGE